MFNHVQDDSTYQDTMGSGNDHTLKPPGCNYIYVLSFHNINNLLELSPLETHFSFLCFDIMVENSLLTRCGT